MLPTEFNKIKKRLLIKSSRNMRRLRVYSIQLLLIWMTPQLAQKKSQDAGSAGTLKQCQKIHCFALASVLDL
jgi:hypothetical protein